MDESHREGESANDYVLRLSESKARAVARAGETVLGADTVVVVEGRLLGKPADRDEAKSMLRSLSGRTHEVLTGVCILHAGQCRTFVERTAVDFKKLSDRELQAYVDSPEPLDKAGAYGIQGSASKFVERIEGCYFNVVGLPIARVYGLLQSLTR